MRVVATEDFKTYYGMVCIDVVAGEEFDGGFAEFLTTGGAPVRALDDGEPASVSGSAEVPPVEDPPPVAESETTAGPEPGVGPGLDITGSAADVLAWVDSDPGRATEALTAEQAKDKPRTGLVKQLTKLAEA
jgi:hypothetical protein